MIKIEDADKSFESCQDCVHAYDSTEICVLRRCIHAFSELRECYKPKKELKPSAQPDVPDTNVGDIISRQEAVEVIDAVFPVDPMKSEYTQGIACGAALAKTYVEQLPSAQPELIEQGAYVRGFEQGRTQGMIDKTIKAEWTNADALDLQPTCNQLATDCISRQAAIDVASGYCHPANIAKELEKLPSAQPERTCVNCGRTVNNGGWYADGGTRCPIEEHYALPKDGYCHLWEKRNVTDDNYPERREE